MKDKIYELFYEYGVYSLIKIVLITNDYILAISNITVQNLSQKIIVYIQELQTQQKLAKVT